MVSSLVILMIVVDQVYETQTLQGDDLVANVVGPGENVGLSPVVPVLPGDQVAGVGEIRLTAGEVPADVVGVQVGEHHQIHRFRDRRLWPPCRS